MGQEDLCDYTLIQGTCIIIFDASLIHTTTIRYLGINLVSAKLPVGVIQASMAFSCESANLLPVGDKFIFLQQDL